MKAALVSLAELIHRQTGIVLKEAQAPALEAALERVAPGTGAERLAAELSRSPTGPLLHRIVNEVTVHETYFFRELRELEAIDWQALLAEAEARGYGQVRVWVAACSSGEEAYSLAILATEALGPRAASVSILATDISTAALARAEAGAGYSERSVRNLSLPLRRRYLVEDDGRYRVKEQIKARVRFRHHNLVADPAPPSGEVPFDVIACRNVLIYFDAPTVESVLASLAEGLRSGGQLILGSADRLTGTAAELDRAGGRRSERAGGRSGEARKLRRPLGLEPVPEVEDALVAADAGELDSAMRIVEGLLAQDPLAADPLFVRGLVELELGETAAAIESLRRCLYVDPSFGLAAFELGRAYDRGGDGRAARRAYQQALRSLTPEDDRHSAILDQVDLGDVAAACATRLRSVGGEPR